MNLKSNKDSDKDVSFWITSFSMEQGKLLGSVLLRQPILFFSPYYEALSIEGSSS
jgi:hypothetical protein